ncbi:hypothetical protein HYH02_008193 [Chlamydomonas schloesseri]|uniref:Uncharacterized protein n=1 Tax=Chlamydomonas schloesseri TaxID=2026947 RepID=A0A836B3V3_9CHLO|nr:hypothetical protein HYH02_008193 [Chlamydomonas schloesseri]|eukprot:KAG2446618.1 hypothetical protein HYH02_008193 [Chlamydomonas schloesseri]
MEAMLRTITAGSAAAANPLLRSVLGPNASAADYAEVAEYAESMWKMMDEMAEQDPEGYQAFIKEQAQVAKEEAEKARDPHVESLAPALVLEAQALQPQAPSVAAAAAGAGGASAPASVANLVGGSKAVARVHVWAATDASGLHPAHFTSGAPLRPGGDAPPGGSWAGLVVPLAEYRPAMSRPGPVPVHHFHVAAHGDAVRAAVADAPAGARGALLEAVTQFAEAEYRLGLSRSVRTLQVHRDAVGDKEFEKLHQQQQERLRKMAEKQAAPAVGTGDAGSGGSAAGAGEPSGLGSSPAAPPSLLQELRTLGAPKPQQSVEAAASGDGKDTSAAGCAAAPAKAKKKPLIEELD